jgi:hypothetical protein
MKKVLIILAVICLVVLTDTGHARSQSNAGPADPVLVGAGDIASCGLDGDEKTARLLDDIEGTVFTVGDNVYPDGTAEQFRDCYGPSWGRHKNRTRPVPGNHDYGTTRATAYYEYFGRRAGQPGLGFYSYDLGAWHIIALNSSIGLPHGSAQEKWLRADLQANPTACTLVYWHHPFFSSLRDGNTPYMRHTWDVLYMYGADIVINGDNHLYERFALQTPTGFAAPGRGIRQFTVGTGGATLARSVGARQAPSSEVRDNSTWGVLKLTLRPTSYDWEFIPVEGGTFRDSGSAPCVNPSEQAIF